MASSLLAPPSPKKPSHGPMRSLLHGLTRRMRGSSNSYQRRECSIESDGNCEVWKRWLEGDTWCERPHGEQARSVLNYAVQRIAKRHPPDMRIEGYPSHRRTLPSTRMVGDYAIDWYSRSRNHELLSESPCAFSKRRTVITRGPSGSYRPSLRHLPLRLLLQISILPISLRSPAADPVVIRNPASSSSPRHPSSAATDCQHGRPGTPIRPSVLDSYQTVTIQLPDARSLSHPVHPPWIPLQLTGVWTACDESMDVQVGEMEQR
ncbi:hypothetical protein NMY22_g16688 [Coprinellus aureogranulatus]|nr:hypothetical protein NMY22_g16688 [Coprinellus aureogranulatus]